MYEGSAPSPFVHPAPELSNNYTARTGESRTVYSHSTDVLPHSVSRFPSSSSKFCRHWLRTEGAFLISVHPVHPSRLSVSRCRFDPWQNLLNISAVKLWQQHNVRART